MLKFALLLRTVYSLTRNGHLDSMSVLNALLSKEPYHQLCLLLLNRSLEFNVNLVESLLKFVDVNYQNERMNGWTLLHHSAYQKDCLLMQTCIKNNANLMITDRNGNSSLHIAIQVAQKRKNNSPLQFTDTLDNQIPIITNNEKEEDKIEYLKIVELILNSVHSTNKNGTETIKSTNKLNKEQQQVSYLNDENNQINRLLKPINNDEHQPNQPNLEILINKQNRFGKTALHYAVFLRPDQFSIKLITILLQNKANPNIFDYRNRTPLFYLLADHHAQHQIAEKNEQKKSINSLNDDNNKMENHSNNDCNFKNRQQQIKHCSKNCKLRSPFIDLLIKTNYYKCDRLNLDELDGITTLKQYCRKVIQKYLNFNFNSITTINNDNNDLGNNINSCAKNLQILLQINNNNMNYKLPISLCNYLSRRTL